MSGSDVSAASVNGDREAVQDRLLFRGRQLRLELRYERRRARSGREEPRHDLLRRPELDELLLERFREAAVSEVPAVELLQEADRALLAELAHRLADEDDELGRHLLAGRAERLTLGDLPERPR